MNKYILIRKANKEDIKEIEKIHKDCVKKINAKFYSSAIVQEWLKQISAENIKDQFKNSIWAVLLIKEKIVGFVQFSIRTKELFQINIKPSLNGRGYGKKMYEYIEKYFIKKRVKIISLNATLNAVKFYNKLGFKKVKRIKFKLNNEFLEMIKMEKHL